MGRPRRNPFRGLIDHISEMNRAQERWFTGPETGREDQRRTHISAWVPATDIFAVDEDLVMRVSLSGVDRDEVDITLSDGVLTVSGERRDDLPDEEEVSFHTRERYYGAFRRSITLPPHVDEGDVSASFVNGLLEITVHGGATAAPEPQRISIQDRSSERGANRPGNS
jgi:HSP20 family protein